MTERYSVVAIWFHWIIATLIVFNLVVALFHDNLAALKRLMPAHEAVGITILVLTIGRIAWRLTHRPPPPPADLVDWQRSTAQAMHWAFYAFLLILPLTGWAMVSGVPKPHPLSWFGIADIPLLPVSGGVSNVSFATHELLGKIMAVLIVMHIAAALAHQFILRDRTLARMSLLALGD